MSPKKQRIAIAEACGWKYWHDSSETFLLSPDERWPTSGLGKKWGTKEGDARPFCPLKDITGLPDYLNNLNAMHEALRTLGFEQQTAFLRELASIVGTSTSFVEGTQGKADFFSMVTAKPQQLTEAFLKAIGKWDK